MIQSFLKIKNFCINLLIIIWLSPIGDLRRYLEVIRKDHEVLPKPHKIINDMQKNRKYHGDIIGESPLVIGIFLKFLNGELTNGKDKYLVYSMWVLLHVCRKVLQWRRWML